MALTKVGKEGITGISNSSDATAITIDSSENVGIGTTGPNNKLDVNGGFVCSPNTDGKDTFEFSTNSVDEGRLRIKNVDSTTVQIRAGGDSYFNGGKVLFGTDSNFGGGNVGHAEFFESGNAAVGIGRGDSDLGACLRFFKVDSGGSGTIVGSVSLASSSTAYNTSSDYRLKTSVTYDWDATTRLKQLKPARFKWISDGESAEFVDGFLAHEAVTVVPEAVSGTKDATEKYTDEDGKEQTKIVPQGIDQSKLVPLLVKTIQELEARITALEAE